MDSHFIWVGIIIIYIYIRSSRVGLYVFSFALAFIYIPTLCVRAEKALARQHGCLVSKPRLLAGIKISSSCLTVTRCLNPFMPNVFSHPYQLDESIYNFRFLGGIISNFKRNFCKQTVESLIRRRVLRRLVWFCTVFLCPTKRTLGFRVKFICVEMTEVQ